MFASFNISEFLIIAAIYSVGVVISQVYLKKIISIIATSSLKRSMQLGVALMVISCIAWLGAFYFFGWSAGAVFVLGAIAEYAIAIIRRATIVDAVVSAYEPLSFNEINGKTL